MVHIAEKSLEVGRSVLSRLEDDFTLDKLLRMEERVLMRVSERNAGEYAWRTGIKLRFRVGKSQTKSRMHRKRAKKAEKAGLLFGEKPTGQLDC